MEGICIRIKELRNEYNLSQVEFAQRLGVTNAHISKIEKGKTIPSEALIKLICKEFKVNELWLKKGSKPMFIEDIEIAIDKSLTHSTEEFNKLLTDSVFIRAQAAQLNMLFAEITNVETLDYNDKLLYLKMCENLFYSISKILGLFKQSAFDNQLSLFDTKDELLVAFNEGVQTVVDTLGKFEEFYIKHQLNENK